MKEQSVWQLDRVCCHEEQKRNEGQEKAVQKEKLQKRGANLFTRNIKGKGEAEAVVSDQRGKSLSSRIRGQEDEDVEERDEEDVRPTGDQITSDSHLMADVAT